MSSFLLSSCMTRELTSLSSVSDSDPVFCWAQGRNPQSWRSAFSRKRHLWGSREQALPRPPGWQWLTCPWPGGPATGGTAPGGPAHPGLAPRHCPGSGSAAAPSLMRRRSHCGDRTMVKGAVPRPVPAFPRGSGTDCEVERRHSAGPSLHQADGLPAAAGLADAQGEGEPL